MIVVCKKYYIIIKTLVKELGVHTKSTYISCAESFDDILRTHANFVNSVGLEMSEEDRNLPHQYWIPKLHKTPSELRFIAGSSKCTTKDLSCLLTKLLPTIKDGLTRHCATKTSRNGANTCGYLKTPHAYCYHLTNWMSAQLHPCRHMTFQHCIPPSHANC